MKSNYVCAGISCGVLLMGACNPAIIDPIGGGPGGHGGQSGEEGGGRSGRPSTSAGKGGDGDAGKSGNSDTGKGGDAGKGRSSDAGKGGDAGSSGSPGGSAGESGEAGAACGPLQLAAEDAFESHRACTQDSDCELLYAPCLFPRNESCGNEYGISKASRALVTAAYDAYLACTGCELGNSCDPEHIAQCSEGVCLSNDTPKNCATTAANAAAEVGDAVSCSLVARVDSVSFAVTGHALVCGPRNAVDEAGARASANAAVTFVSSGLSGGVGELLSGPAPSDVWLFKQIWGDFGHVSAVSAQSGQTLFWGELDYGGNPGQPTVAGLRRGYPEAPVPWATSEIGSGCYVVPELARRAWDLRVGQSPDPVDAPERLVIAGNRVLGSAFVKGMTQSLSLTSSVTLHYGEGTVAAAAAVSEYIVIVSAAR